MRATQFVAEIERRLKQNENGKENSAVEKTVEPLVMTMDKIEPEVLEWLWPGRIPLGRLTLLDGDPGAGKSRLSRAVAAAVTRGDALPGGEKSSPSSVLILCIEDGLADTVRPDLDALGADVSRVAVPNPKRGLPSAMLNASFIEQAVKVVGPKLLIIDPIIAFAGRRNTEKANETRELLSPLMSIAERYALACLIIRHFTKQVEAGALHRGSGSVDFIAAARSALVIVESDSEPNMRVLAQVKNSSGSKSRSLTFYIDDRGFRWGSEVDISAEELLAASRSNKRNNERTELQKAKNFLQAELSQGPRPNRNIKNKARQAGISDATLWRAKEQLSVRASKERGTGEWWWRL